MFLFRILFLLASLTCTTVFARLGETPDQFSARYGPPKDSATSEASDRNFPLLEGAIHHIYEYEGRRIRAAFVEPNGPAVRMEYSKLIKAGVNPSIQDYELQAIMSANTPSGTTWKQMPYSNPDSPNKGLAKMAEGFIGSAAGQKMWRRTDGAILWLRSNLIVRLELPAALEYEDQLKAAREKKARESVPQF